MKRTLAALGAVIALAAAGCGGGSGQSPNPPAPGSHTQDTAKATLRIVIPAKQSDSSARRPQYVSPDTKSVSFKVPAMTSASVVALTPGSSNCPANQGGGYTCTASFTAPIGTGEALTVNTYASSDGSGTPLSTNTVPIDVSATGDNAVTVTLNGVAAKLLLTLSPNTVDSGSSANITATWSAVDAAGDAIVGPGSLVDSQNKALTVALTSDASGGITIGDANGHSFPVTYDGSAIDSPTFTAKATGASGVTNGTAVLTVNVPATPTPSPTPAATATPQNAIVNGTFASGSLAPGWTACSYAHTPFAAPVNASPAPAATAGQTGTPPPISQATVNGLAAVQSPPPNFNPGVTLTPPPSLGSDAAFIGQTDGQTAGAAGICQTVTVPSDATSLSFWVYEGGSQYNFKYADQEADILDSTGSTLEATLFAEENCFINPGVLGTADNTTGGCTPSALGGTSKYSDWQGGYWTQRGPYDLSAFSGQTITLFVGVWDLYDDAAPSTYANFMFVGDVRLTAGGGTAPVPITVQTAGGHR